MTGVPWRIKGASESSVRHSSLPLLTSSLNRRIHRHVLLPPTSTSSLRHTNACGLPDSIVVSALRAPLSTRTSPSSSTSTSPYTALTPPAHSQLRCLPPHNPTPRPPPARACGKGLNGVVPARMQHDCQSSPAPPVSPPFTPPLLSLRTHSRAEPGWTTPTRRAPPPRAAQGEIAVSTSPHPGAGESFDYPHVTRALVQRGRPLQAASRLQERSARMRHSKLIL